MPDILAQICDDKRVHIAQQRQAAPLAVLQARIKEQSNPRGFYAALQNKQQDKQPGIIAELKKASPSKGVIREDFDPVTLAKAYREGGATCLSVLTDEPYFHGSDEYIGLVKQAVDLPILRKDFIIDLYQVYETRALGADCMLLIMAAIDDDFAREATILAQSLGLDVLIEVHNMEELERALQLPSKLIGINNRNLKTLEVDLQTSISLKSSIPEGYVVICESGIKTHDDITQMQSHNMHCFLVGESLMLQENVSEALKSLITGG